ncbi:hypothetical protein H4R33_004734, partial [Dimargaris cristalligena]
LTVKDLFRRLNFWGLERCKDQGGQQTENTVHPEEFTWNAYTSGSTDQRGGGLGNLENLVPSPYMPGHYQENEPPETLEGYVPNPQASIPNQRNKEPDNREDSVPIAATLSHNQRSDESDNPKASVSDMYTPNQTKRTGGSDNADKFAPKNKPVRRLDYTPAPLAPEVIWNPYQDLQAGLKSYWRGVGLKAKNSVISEAHLKSGIRAMYKPWQKLLRHQLALGVWRKACRIMYEIFEIQNTDAGASEVLEYAKPQPKGIILGDLLEIGKDSPLFQKGAQRYINPADLSEAELTKQLPLLDLVDALTHVKQVVPLFATLTNPSFDLLVKQDRKRIEELVPAGPEGPLWTMIKLWDLPAYKHLAGFNYEMFSNTVAAIIMARLAFTGRQDQLQLFATGVRTYQDEYSQSSFYVRNDELGKLAVMLCAMTRQTDLLRITPSEFLGHILPRQYKPAAVEPNCSLVGEMHQLGLKDSAQFLFKTLSCPEPKSNQRPDAEEVVGPYQFLHLMQLRLVELDGIPQMGVPVIITEFEADTQEKIKDLGPWKHDTLWKVGKLFLEQRPDLKQY